MAYDFSFNRVEK
jgi:vacuolar protein sorting-associated protein 26